MKYFRKERAIFLFFVFMRKKCIGFHQNRMSKIKKDKKICTVGIKKGIIVVQSSKKW